MIKKITFVILVFLLFSTSSYAWVGKVVKIADGDTITVLNSNNEQVKIRLYGVDAPEKKQEFGTKSKDFTADFCFGKEVEVQAVDTDRYGRTVGRIYHNNKELNIELVKNGYAWVYSQYCKDSEYCGELKDMEEIARSDKAGLWKDSDPTPPWLFRKDSKKKKNIFS